MKKALIRLCLLALKYYDPCNCSKGNAWYLSKRYLQEVHKDYESINMVNKYKL